MPQNKISELQTFYKTPQGQIARWLLRQKIINMVKPNDDKVAGFGFVEPYQDILVDKRNFKNFGYEFLDNNSEEIKIALKDSSLKGIAAIHAVENCPNPEKLVAEFWRILEPGGKLLIISGNKKGFWKKTPLAGHHPTDKDDIFNLLVFNKFAPRSFDRALFFPPNNHIPTTKTLEKIFSVIFRIFSGALIFRSEKVVFAPKGRLLKVTPSLFDRIMKPKPAAQTRDLHKSG